MLVSEIIDYVLFETGNYLVEPLLKEEVDLPRFMRLLKAVLSQYGQYRPLNKNIQIYVTSNPYTFYDETAPQVIHQMNTGYFSTPGVFESDPFRVYERQHIPAIPPWRYERPNLYTHYTGFLDLKATFDFLLNPVTDTSDEIIDYDIPDLSFNDTEFLHMVLARFLMTTGRQRRAYTANDMPIASDASDMVSEGQELWNTTIERLQEKAKWWTVV